MMGRTRVPADRRAASTCSRCRPTVSTGSGSPPTSTCRPGTRSGSRWTSCRCWCCSTAGPASSATASCPGASRMAEKLRAQFETETLPRFIARSAGTRPRASRSSARRSPTGCCGGPEQSPWLMALLQVDAASGQSAYFLPLALALETATKNRCARSARRLWRGCASRRKSACWPTPSPTKRSAARWWRRSAPDAKWLARRASCASRRPTPSPASPAMRWRNWR